jgi:hypothetical protein
MVKEGIQAIATSPFLSSLLSPTKDIAEEEVPNLIDKDSRSETLQKSKGLGREKEGITELVVSLSFFSRDCDSNAHESTGSKNEFTDGNTILIRVFFKAKFGWIISLSTEGWE